MKDDRQMTPDEERRKLETEWWQRMSHRKIIQFAKTRNKAVVGLGDIPEVREEKDPIMTDQENSA